MSDHPDDERLRGGPRGELRIHLGAAPGVGKTFAMLGEAHRRLGRGTDVVAAGLLGRGAANVVHSALRHGGRTVALRVVGVGLIRGLHAVTFRARSLLRGERCT